MFNKKARKGLEYLQAKGMLGRAHEETILFPSSSPPLSPGYQPCLALLFTCTFIHAMQNRLCCSQHHACLQDGIALFNKKARKGLEYLQAEGMLGRAPEDVAVFLARTAGLDKTLIGDYLGEREEFNLKVGWGSGGQKGKKTRGEFRFIEGEGGEEVERKG